jgi:hypothetical protein
LSRVHATLSDQGPDCQKLSNYKYPGSFYPQSPSAPAYSLAPMPLQAYRTMYSRWAFSCPVLWLWNFEMAYYVQTDMTDQQVTLSQDSSSRPSWTLQIIGPGCTQAKLSTNCATYHDKRTCLQTADPGVAIGPSRLSSLGSRDSPMLFVASPLVFLSDCLSWYNYSGTIRCSVVNLKLGRTSRPAAKLHGRACQLVE